VESSLLPQTVGISTGAEMSSGARGDLRQLVVAGPMRFIVGFGESRAYLDSLAGLTRVPRSPQWLLGVFSSDGASVPLVDIDAWAHQTRPAAWKYTDSLGASQFVNVRVGAAGATGAAAARQLRALQFGDGASAWAIRVSEAPAVVSLAAHQAQSITNRLPLQVSANNGRLMHHAHAAWTLGDKVPAIEVRWSSLAEVLRQELSGISSAERRKE
jgi:chemotaxis signal transduction protein